MILSPQDKYTFVAIPRTGSTTVHVALSDGPIPEPKFHHATISEILEWCPKSRSYFKFAFVRNPWDRLLSAYCEFDKHRGRKYSHGIKMPLMLLNRYRDFNDFCEKLPDKYWRHDVHFKPQVDFVLEHGRNVMDFVGRYESFGEDLERLGKIIDFPPQTVHHKKTCHGDYRGAYTDKTQKIVEDIFAADIEEFGYEF